MKVSKSRNQGYTLPSVLVISALAIALYASAVQWTWTSTRLNDRNNIYNCTLAAAEGASENVLSHITRDFLNQTYNPADLNRYEEQIPSADWIGSYRFSDGEGHSGRINVEGSPTTVTTNLDSQFNGLYGLVYTSTIRAEARPLNTSYDIGAAVEQKLQLASIPIFQFAIFYSMDLEINPGPEMTITGKVHGNANLYLAPVNGLTFLDDVAATDRVFLHRHPDDPTSSGKVTPVFKEPYVENVSSLTLPIATNNSPETVQGIVDEPPFNEDPDSPSGKARYYNNCDLIITVTPTNVLVKSGAWDDFNAIGPDVNPGKTNAYYSFISTNGTFYDDREGKMTVLTDFDVGKLNAWLNAGGGSLNSKAKLNLGHDLNSVYIQETRLPSGKLSAVRVVNGRTLPSSGLTLVTPRPLYVKGHFNAPNVTAGYTNTVGTKPASLVGDSITVLSDAWTDSANDATTDPLRAAANTTVNAALLAGIVPTTNYWGTKHYSGGVENFPRFLEDWTGDSLTYNGSMVVLFPSRFATGWWKSPAAYPTGYYQAPTRRWAFDLNFLDHRKLPPATPQVRKLIRGQWSVVAVR
jgi:hypothetical protein